MTESRLSPQTFLVDVRGLPGREAYRWISEVSTFVDMPYMPSILVANLPTTRVRIGSIAFCSDEAGGATLVFYDGTDWRRVQDAAVAS